MALVVSGRVLASVPSRTCGAQVSGAKHASVGRRMISVIEQAAARARMV